MKKTSLLLPTKLYLSIRIWGKRFPKLFSVWITLSYHPFINPIVNPADILPVKGIPKLIIANQEAVAAEWTSPAALLLIPGICIVRLASVVSAPDNIV